MLNRDEVNLVVLFESDLGYKGMGVIHLCRGRLYGGDGGYRYRGTLKVNGGLAVANVHVKRLDPTAVSIFGPVEEFWFDAAGNVVDGVWRFSGFVRGAPFMRLRFKLHSLQSVAAE